MNITKSILLNVDSYKLSHYKCYQPGTTNVSSYIESRGGEWQETVFFGLQAFIKEYLTKPFTLEDVNEAEEIAQLHGVPFNREGWMYILNKYNGLLPVRIQAVPEGLVMPTHNVLVQIVNTDEQCAWLTSYLETALLRAVWYPTTVATQSFQIKRIIRRFLEETGDVAGLPFKLHDFGARGVSSLESAGIGGAAHLVNFMGTDTLTGALYARKYYGEAMAGFSIPAAEHSTITSWGGPENEVDAFRNMLKQFAQPGKLVAVVSDSYDIYNAAKNLWGKQLKAEVENSGATLVVRPDSGDPTVVPIEVIEILGESFGYTTNAKGYKVLPACVRVIQGDGVNAKSIETILTNLKAKGWSADNIAFGMGGALLQGVNRDTLKFAMKASAAKVNGYWIDVFKDPITDSGKKSKKGRLALVREVQDGYYRTVRQEHIGDITNNVLETVFENGKLIKTTNFKEVRELSEKGLTTLLKREKPIFSIGE